MSHRYIWFPNHRPLYLSLLGFVGVPLFILGLAEIVVACAGNGNPEVSALICSTPFEAQLVESCPALTPQSWKDTQLCIHSTRLAYEVKMIACIADGVLTEPGVE